MNTFLGSEEKTTILYDKEYYAFWDHMKQEGLRTKAKYIELEYNGKPVHWIDRGNDIETTGTVVAIASIWVTEKNYDGLQTVVMQETCDKFTLNWLSDVSEDTLKQLKNSLTSNIEVIITQDSNGIPKVQDMSVYQQ